MKFLNEAGLARFYEGLQSRFLRKDSVANNLTTTEAGKVLDARQGKAIMDYAALKAAEGASAYTHTKTGTTHDFVGSGRLGFAELTADYAEGDAFTVNGQTATVVGDKSALTAEGSAIFSVAGEKLYLYSVCSPFVAPVGMTALPVNNVKLWVECTGTTYASMGSPTLAQVLADEGMCQVLMDSQNAVNYMLRSPEIQQAVLASTTAVSALESSLHFVNVTMSSNTLPDGYATYAADTATNAYLATNSNINAGYATNNITTAVQHWLRIKLPKKVWVYKCTLNIWTNNGTYKPTFKLQGSNDGEAWTDVTGTLTSAGSNAAIQTVPITQRGVFYQYYRIWIVSNTYANGYYGGLRIGALRFYGKTMEEVY